MTPSPADLDRADRILRGIDPQTPEGLQWARHVAYRSLDYKLVALADLHNGPGVPRGLVFAATLALTSFGILLAWWLA